MPPTGYLFKNNPGENAKGRKVEIDIAYVETMLYILTQIHDFKRSLDSLAIELDVYKRQISYGLFNSILSRLFFFLLLLYEKSV